MPKDTRKKKAPVTKPGRASAAGTANAGGNGGELHQTASAPRSADHQPGHSRLRQPEQLKAGPRGPVLLEDFVLREKILHFDHERIPERIVHARGSAAHGFFELYESLADITRADLFQRKGERTPVFARFSTVAGGAGSVDTPRDVRGFAVKFYTKEGNWDLVGNNIPVFFIQDAIKFPDLVHAVKMEADRGYPQAASAHDTFWDFISLMPESTHMIMWAMSDRTIPRSLRMMEGFGVHTFRLVNDDGQVDLRQVPLEAEAGPAVDLWDEAVKIAGADPDYHRRDLFEAIDSGDFPGMGARRAAVRPGVRRRLPFDVLDATKLIPEELLPVQHRRPAWCSTATRTTSSPRPSRSPSAPPTCRRASTSPTIRCCRAGCSPISTPSSRGSAGRTSTRSRSTRPRDARS